MKKNAIGHMVAPKESAGSKIRRWNLLPRLLCLLLAVLFWLLVVNVKRNKSADTDPEIPLPLTESELRMEPAVGAEW